MKLSYYIRNNIEYAKIPGKSVRSNGSVHKEGEVYLGRVIDKAHNVFCSRERGTFTYDPETRTYGSASETYSSELKDDGRRKAKVLLDFGDAFLVDALLTKMHYSEVLDAISYRNRDTLYAMIEYYTLNDKANDHALTWYEGSYASILYPNANLTSQRISDFLASIGKMENLSAFFDAHIAWLKKYATDDPAVLIDSTGLPNSIHFPLTAISNHNGKISREVRMTTILQRDSGYPLMFRINPGNIVDCSTLTRSVNEAIERGLKVDMAIIDAGYCTKPNIDELYGAHIEWLTRLPETHKVWKQMIQKESDDLRSKGHLVKYLDRYVYIKRVPIKVGTASQYEAYAFLGYDVERAADETRKVTAAAQKKKMSAEQLSERLDKVGYFVIVTSLCYTEEDILPAYYTRQLVEQYFDIDKGISNLTPLRIHHEEALRGHLLLSMIASTINVYVQKQTKKLATDREELFMSLRNQKCIVYKSKILTSEAQKKANEFYNGFDITCPISIDRSGDKLKPQYHLPEIDVDEA